MEFQILNYLDETANLSQLEKLKYLWNSSLKTLYLSLTIPLLILIPVIQWRPLIASLVLALLLVMMFPMTCLLVLRTNSSMELGSDAEMPEHVPVDNEMTGLVMKVDTGKLTQDIILPKEQPREGIDTVPGIPVKEYQGINADPNYNDEKKEMNKDV